jgi:hypothetical protein
MVTGIADGGTVQERAGNPGKNSTTRVAVRAAAAENPATPTGDAKSGAGCGRDVFKRSAPGAIRPGSDAVKAESKAADGTIPYRHAMGGGIDFHAITAPCGITKDLEPVQIEGDSGSTHIDAVRFRNLEIC